MNKYEKLLIVAVSVAFTYWVWSLNLNTPDMVVTGLIMVGFYWIFASSDDDHYRRNDWSTLVSEWKESLVLDLPDGDNDPIVVAIRAGRVLRVDHDYIGFERHGVRFMLPTDSIVKIISVEVPFEDKPNVVVQVNREYWNKFGHGLHVGELKDLIRER